MRVTRGAALAAAVSAALLACGQASDAAMQPIFAGDFGPGWAAAQTSFSWGGAVAAVPGRGRRGGSAVCATLGPWGGASLATLAQPLEPSVLLSLWLAPHGAAPLNLSSLELMLGGVDDNTPLRPESSARLARFCTPAGCARDARGWTQLAVPLLEFGPWTWSRLSLKDVSGRGAAFCLDDVYAANVFSASRWALLDESASGAPAPAAGGAAAVPPAQAAPRNRTETAARVSFWVTWAAGSAAALPAEGTPERDAFLRALRRDVSDWLASAAGGDGDAKGMRLKITQVQTQDDGMLAMRFSLALPAEDVDAAASRRLLDVRSAVTGAVSTARSRAEAAAASLAGMMRRNSLPAPAGPVLRALGRGQISGVAVEVARTQAAAPAPAASLESQPIEDGPALLAPAEPPAQASVEEAPSMAKAEEAPAQLQANTATAAAPASAAHPASGLEAAASSPAPAPMQQSRGGHQPAILVVVAALVSLLLGLGALACCGVFAWRRRTLPQQQQQQQQATAQRAWLQGWHAAAEHAAPGKQIPALELGACGDGAAKGTQHSS